MGEKSYNAYCKVVLDYQKKSSEILDKVLKQVRDNFAKIDKRAANSKKYVISWINSNYCKITWTGYGNHITKYFNVVNGDVKEISLLDYNNALSRFGVSSFYRIVPDI